MMPVLPPRSFICLTEAAIRWSATPFDLIGWSTDGLLSLSIALPPVKIGPTEILSGIAEIEAPHALPLFRYVMPAQAVPIRRVRIGDGDFRWIMDPAEGVIVTAADVLIKRTDIERFEQRIGFRCGAGAEKPASGRRPGPGAPPRHDWDAFHAALTRRIHDHGIPKTQAELVREMVGWFESREDEHAPDESTIRRKVAVVWREVNR